MAFGDARVPGGQGLLGGKLTDLKQRLLFVLGALIVFRVGTHIPVPGIDPVALAEMFKQTRARSSTCSICSRAARSNAFRCCARCHAVYFGLHHHAAHDDGGTKPRAAQKGRRERPAQDYPVHALWHGGARDLSGTRHCHCPRRPARRRCAGGDRAGYRIQAGNGGDTGYRHHVHCVLGEQVTSAASATAFRSSFSPVSWPDCHAPLAARWNWRVPAPSRRRL